MENENIDELRSLMDHNIREVERRISEACNKAGRKREEITLIGVSKVFPASHAKAAVMCGLKDLGENRVQELVPKYEELKGEGLCPNWHLIGTLQKNKVKYIIGKTYLIHSVDSVELALEIAKRSHNAGIVTDILLQANVSGEESKHGFAPGQLKEAVDELNNVTDLRVRGLMTMAPIEQYEGQALEVFTETKRIFDDLKGLSKEPSSWDCLSMGMSQDFESAILAGSTHIRIGTAIFGDRKHIDSH